MSLATYGSFVDVRLLPVRLFSTGCLFLPFRCFGDFFCFPSCFFMAFYYTEFFRIFWRDFFLLFFFRVLYDCVFFQSSAEHFFLLLCLLLMSTDHFFSSSLTFIRYRLPMRGSIDFPGLARVNEVGHHKKYREPVFKNVVSTYFFSKNRGIQKYWCIHRQHFHFLKPNPHHSIEQSYKPLCSERDVLCRRTAVKFCSSVARWITWLTGHSRTRYPRKKNPIFSLPLCICIYFSLRMHRCRLSSSATLVTFTAARTTRVAQLTYSV